MRVGIVLLVLTAAGCGGGAERERVPLADKVGKNCTVQFRRGDGLGSAAPVPVAPTSSNHNGADLAVFGTLTAVSANWIVVTKDAREWHIPRDAVLLVEFQK